MTPKKAPPSARLAPSHHSALPRAPFRVEAMRPKAQLAFSKVEVHGKIRQNQRGSNRVTCLYSHRACKHCRERAYTVSAFCWCVVHWRGNHGTFSQSLTWLSRQAPGLSLWVAKNLCLVPGTSFHIPRKNRQAYIQGSLKDMLRPKSKITSTSFFKGFLYLYPGDLLGGIL